MARRKLLSTARSRVELIASHSYGEALASPPPPPAEEKAPAPAKTPTETDPDQAVTDALAKVKTAVDAAVAAQKADDDSDDPKDQKVTADLAALSKAVDAAIADQAADAADESENPSADEKPAPEKPAVTAAAAEPETPKTNPVAPNGDIDNDVQCANPDCGHLASAHLDDAEMGANTGACSMTDCSCLATQVESQPNTGGDDQGSQPAAPEGKEDLATADAPVAPGPAPSAPEQPAGLNEPPPVAGGDSMGPAFTIPVAIIEGQPTGDGRQIAPNALTWRTPPVPLMGLATETHDPDGFDMNAPAVLCGRIDSFERQPGDGDTQVIVAKGFFLPNDDGMYFAELAEAMGRIGVSADVAVQASEIEVGDVDPMGFPLEMSETLTEGVIMGITVCPFPAFEGAYLVLGDGAEKPEAQAIPQQADEPPTMDKPPAAVTAGGQLIHLMTYEQCEPCDQGLEVITAAGQGPTRPPRAWFSDPGFTEDDGRLVEILDRRGNRVIGGKFACPLTVEDSGRVYGHIAPWGVCHTGHSGQCILAPHSKAGYAHFLRGQHVVTAEGEKVRVGVITCDAGHASTRGISASQAMAHYDNTALAVADVTIGEDEYGIWVAGAMRPDASEEQIRALRASSISGDWRQLGGTLELVAALAVNQPGFPLAVVASGQHEALVAAGASVMHRVKHPAPSSAPEAGDVALRAALGPLLGDAKAKARERLAALR